MKNRKPLPSTLKKDQRRVYPIDELRVQYWLHEVGKYFNLKTNYSFSKKFGGEPNKWKNYKKGGQPNQDVIDLVRSELEGSDNLYKFGPKSKIGSGYLYLWQSLSSETKYEDLLKISQFSTELDGKIAQIRIDAINNQTNCISITADNHEPIQNYWNGLSRHIYLQLKRLIDDAPLSNLAMSIFNKLLEPSISKEKSRVNSEFSDAFMQNKYTYADQQKIITEFELNGLEMPTVKNKGHR